METGRLAEMENASTKLYLDLLAVLRVIVTPMRLSAIDHRPLIVSGRLKNAANTELVSTDIVSRTNNQKDAPQECRHRGVVPHARKKRSLRTCLSNGKWSSWSSCICPPSTGPTTVRPCDFDPICSNKISSRTNCGAAYPTSCQGGCNKSAGRSGGIVCVTGQDCINGKCVRPPPPPPKCTHGQSETKNCDECPGRFSRRYCSSSGSWGSWSSCNCPERECTPGVRDSGSCPGCSEISRYRTCSSSGRWGGWSSCNCPERECTPGKREYKRCSECSTRFTYKRCSSSGSWGSWRSCNCPPPPTCDRSPSCSFRSNSRTKCGATYPTACQGGCDTSSRRLIGGTRCGIGQRCRSGSCEYVRSDGGACNTDFDCRSGYYCDGDTCVRS